jgi:hypothetical protein
MMAPWQSALAADSQRNEQVVARFPDNLLLFYNE